MTLSVIDYHERTKHHPHRYARSLGYLDWANQPDPFRRYHEAPELPLPRPLDPNRTPLNAIYRGVPGPARAVTDESISALLFYSLALSAWKALGTDRWALRCNPSSGNLHPTEAYLIGAPRGLGTDRPSLFHYAPQAHALERLHGWDDGFSADWVRTLSSSLLVALTSIPWRESWKYGERAFRYCQLDLGHAVASLAFAAALEGWAVQLISTVSDDTIATLTGVASQSGPEAEQPDCLLAVTPPVEGSAAALRCVEPVRWPAAANHRYLPNQLSGAHHPWPIIDQVVNAAAKPTTEPFPAEPLPPAFSVPASLTTRSAGDLLRTRRSAVAMDRETGLTASQLYRILALTLPAADNRLWQVFPWSPRVHLLLYLHRIDGLPPGLYFFARRQGALELAQQQFRDRPKFEKPDGCPGELPLYCLEQGDCQELAGAVSCGQDIAADGAFAVSMLAEFESPLARFGPWFYRYLHWEAGAIGQVLYIEAEAAGVRGTGIGCYFDDAIHRILGLSDRTFHCLYNFTVGGPIADQRIQTLPAYPS